MPKKTIKTTEWTSSVIKMHWTAVTTTILSVAFFGTLGYIGDAYFGTRPILLIVGVVISFAATQVIVLKSIAKHTSKLTSKK